MAPFYHCCCSPATSSASPSCVRVREAASVGCDSCRVCWKSDICRVWFMPCVSKSGSCKVWFMLCVFQKSCISRLWFMSCACWKSGIRRVWFMPWFEAYKGSWNMSWGWGGGHVSYLPQSGLTICVLQFLRLQKEGILRLTLPGALPVLRTKSRQAFYLCNPNWERST